MDNIYYSPESYGLRVIMTIDHNDEPYQFDMTVYWTDDNGNFYTASDSGCSCPTPFENYHSVEELERITPQEFTRQTNVDAGFYLKSKYNEYGEAYISPEPIVETKETNSDY